MASGKVLFSLSKIQNYSASLSVFQTVFKSTSPYFHRAWQRMGSTWCLRGIQVNTWHHRFSSEPNSFFWRRDWCHWTTGHWWEDLVRVGASSSVELLHRTVCLTCTPKSLLPSKVRPESTKRPAWEMRNRREMQLVLWQTVCSRNGNWQAGFALQWKSIFCQ